MASPELVWTRIHLPRPLDPAHVAALLLTLASDRRSPDISFELRADRAEVVYLIGCPKTSVHPIRRMLRDQLVGIQFQSAPARPPASEAGRMVLRPRELPLRTDNPTDVCRALLSAITMRLRSEEMMVIQVLLGRRRPPRLVHPEAPSVNRSWWHKALNGVSPAGAEEHRMLSVRAEDAGFDAIVRVGTHGTDPARTRQLTLNLHSALATAKGPGVRMDFIRESPVNINGARRPRRWPLELTRLELLAILAWPLGDADYPGLPPQHPARLRADSRVHHGDRVFASSLAPGDGRQMGISARDALLHTITYGPTNSGKSTIMLHLVEADMRAGHSVVVLDPKRQLVDDVLARVPKERLDDVVILDVSDANPIGFNPLDVTGRDPDVVVDGIMSVFASLFRDGFGPRTLDIFSGTMRSLARAAATTGQVCTVADIPRMLTEPAFRRQVLAAVADDEGLAGFWAWYDSRSPAAQSAAISAPLNKLRQLLLRPALMRMLDQRQSRFRLRDIYQQGAIVLVPLNEAQIGAGTAELLGSLVVADIWQAVQERATEAEPTKRPGFVYIDEAPRFLHLPTSLADALALSRSMGVGWFLAAQFARQFPKELRAAIDMNARSKIIFGTEYDDATHFARGSDQIKAADFMALGRFQTYVNLVADGTPTGWALAQTLPPSASSSRPSAVIARSKARWGALPPSATAAPPTANATGTGPDRADQRSQTGQPGVGRKRRTT